MVFAKGIKKPRDRPQKKSKISINSGRKRVHVTENSNCCYSTIYRRSVELRAVNNLDVINMAAININNNQLGVEKKVE